MHQSRVEMTEAEEKFVLLKKEGFEKIEQIPDNVDEINKHPIAKPLLEFIKQRKIFKQIFLQNLNYLKSAYDEYNQLLEIDYNKDMDLAKAARRVIELQERNIVCLNGVEEMEEKTLVEIYTLISKEKNKEVKK